MTCGLEWRSRQQKSCNIGDHQRSRSKATHVILLRLRRWMIQVEEGGHNIYGDIAGDEMMIGVGNFRYVYV